MAAEAGGFRDFSKFHIEQAIGFKRHLAGEKTQEQANRSRRPRFIGPLPICGPFSTRGISATFGRRRWRNDQYLLNILYCAELALCGAAPLGGSACGHGWLKASVVRTGA
jgi:hypothetical protein